MVATEARWRGRQWRRVTIALVALLAAVPSLAQGGGPAGGGTGGHGQGGGTMFFDPRTIVTMSGTVTATTPVWELWGNGNHTGGGMDVTFRADGGTLFDLMLAPAWFLQEAGIVLSAGERITVTGSRIEAYGGGHNRSAGFGAGGMMGGGDGDRDFLIATAIAADGVRLDLRDRDGYPLWRGGPGAGMPWFDPDTLATLTGTLTEQQGMWGAFGVGNHTGSGMHYVFDAEGASYYSMLGPWWYMESLGLRLESGQRATITGSVVEAYWSGHGDRPYLIATEIVVGGIVVPLRDEWGYPLWQGTGWHYSSPAWADGTMGTATGQVQAIRHRRNGRQLDTGYEVLLRAGNVSYRIFVAPDWYVRDLGMRLRRGDQITVQGAVIGTGHNREVVAQALDVGRERWKFRNGDGAPLWLTGSF